MESTTSPYPLRITGELSPRLSRGLWLVKWLLAIPHFVVLVFLWIAFVVVSVVAFFAILFTGRYPRRCSTSTSASCAGPGASASTPTARSAPTSYPPFTLNDVTRLPGPARGRLPRVALAWTRAGEVVAARAAALPGRRGVRWRRLDRHDGARAASWSGVRGGLIGLLVVFAGDHAAVHRPLPEVPLRLRARNEPLGLPRRRIRRADDRCLPAVPARSGRRRATGRNRAVHPRAGDPIGTEHQHLH